MRQGGKLRQSIRSDLIDFSNFKGTLLARANGNRTSYRLEFFKLNSPLETDYTFTFSNVDYKLKERAEGVLLLVPIPDPLTYDRSNTLPDLINSYPPLKASGMELDSLQHKGKRQDLHSPSESGYELLTEPKSKPERAIVN